MMHKQSLWLLVKQLERLIMQYISFALLFHPAAYQPGEACAAVAEGGTSSAATLLLCRACGHELAVGTDIHFVPSRLALSSRNNTSIGGRRVNVQLFENPHGHQFEVITFRKADVTQHWPANEHFSWFPGFSWTAATCPQCKTHLGWAFQPTDWPDTITEKRFDESEHTFLALIAQRLLREDFASSLLVTCLTASSAYHIVVSGSRDRTCIIWDLNKLSFVTQLRGHRAPVSALCINELTGDIVSCAGTYIHVWSINGSPIASANTFTGRSQQILCCCVSEMNEWDTQNVIVTGHSDGVVRFWRMEFLQVPETPAPEPVEPDVPDCCGEEKIEGSENHNGDEDSSESDGDEPSLSQEPKAPRNPSTGGGSQPGSAVHRPRGPSARTGASWSMDSSSDDSHRWSDTLSIDEKDGFVFVNYSEGQTKVPHPHHHHHPHHHPHPAHPGQSSVPQPSIMDARTYNQLRAGYRWERQLVFRSKLTMHTAFDRKDNAQPAEITSLAISKDHSKILVGDGRGRVFSWSVSDQPGRSAADHWVKDEVVDSCSACTVRFSLTERRHHCRNCGQLFCQKCSRFQSEIKRLKISSPVRVCQNCYYNLQHERSSEDGCRN